MFFYGSPCRWNNAQTEHHQEPNFHHYNDDMSTNEDLHHKREQNGDEELTSMLQRYLDNSCSNISGSMGKNMAIELGIIFIDRSSGKKVLPTLDTSFHIYVMRGFQKYETPKLKYR